MASCPAGSCCERSYHAGFNSTVDSVGLLGGIEGLTAVVEIGSITDQSISNSSLVGADTQTLVNTDLVRVSFKDLNDNVLSNVQQVYIHNISASESYVCVPEATPSQDTEKPFWTYSSVGWINSCNQYIDNDKFIVKRLRNISSHVISDVALLHIDKVIADNVEYKVKYVVMNS